MEAWGGQRANEALAALTDIGAEKTAAIYRRVLDAVGTPVPQDKGARLEMITDDAGKVLDECDAAFSAEADDLQALCKQYILAHRAQFSHGA